MKKIVLISILIHVVLLVVLAPWLKTRMEFDKQEEAIRTAEVEKRELERQEYERNKREKQKLNEKQAKQLKREAEQRKREEIAREVERLKKLREEIAEKHRQELEKFRERDREDVIAMEHIDFKRMASQLEKETGSMRSASAKKQLVAAAYGTGERPLDGAIDDLRVYKRLLSDADISSPPANGMTRHWRFEDDLKDEVSGEIVGKLERAAKFTESPVDGSFALRGDAGAAHAKLGDLDFGDQFTIAFQVLANPREIPQLLVANCHWRDYNIGFRLEVDESKLDAKKANLSLITSGDKGNNNQGEITTTNDGAFPLNEWVRVALRFDRATQKADIFINGKNVTAPDGEVASDTFTQGTNIDSSLHERARDLENEIKENPPTPENAGEYKEKFEKLGEDIAAKMEDNPDLHNIRTLIKETTEMTGEIAEKLDGLAAKMDMAAMNDTSDATAKFEAQPPSQPANAAEMYETAQEMEKEIAEAKADMQAAKDATMNNTSFSEERSQTSATTPSRPNLGESLAKDPVGTVGELNEFRKSLAQAESEIKDMNARAENALGRGQEAAQGSTRPGAAFATQAARINAARGTQSYGTVVNMVAFGASQSEGTSEGMRMGDDPLEGINMKLGEEGRGPKLNETDILKNALPGRRFTKDSMRRGWLYIDTWYVIGPWENNSEIDYSNVHPPEHSINFDAVYGNGKYSAEEGHRDQYLKWEFYQSDQARCQPPRVYGASTYYAYTDLWFEQPRDMLIAVASDDASRVWLNGEIIWQDEGLSPWKLGEGYRQVHFEKGHNTMLVRIENGPAHCVWSVLLCPPDVIKASK